MGQAEINHVTVEAPVLELVRRERRMALSLREWKHRLAGYGYTVKEVNGNQLLMSMRRGVVLGVLPASTV